MNDISGYDYLDNISLDGWNWEFIRRNNNYRQSYSDYEELTQKPKDDICYIWAGLNKHTEVTEYRLVIERLLKTINARVKRLKINEATKVITSDFHIKPFYDKEPYGCFFPDPKLRYNQLPDHIKPICSKLTHPNETEVLEPVTALTAKELKRKIKEHWPDESLWATGPQEVCYDLILQILSPGSNIKNTQGASNGFLTPVIFEDDILFLGISQSAKKNDARNSINSLLKRHLKPKIGKGETKCFPSQWKSYMEVWDIWEKIGTPVEKKFSEIASILRGNEATVKNRWYSAFKLIYGEKYNPQKFKSLNKKTITEAYLLCSNCKDLHCYKLNNYGEMEQSPCDDFKKLVPKEFSKEKLMSPEMFNITLF